MGHIPLIPTGGVTLENAKEFLLAGAIAVGVSGSLFPEKGHTIHSESEQYALIAQRAQTLMQNLVNYQTG